MKSNEWWPCSGRSRVIYIPSWTSIYTILILRLFFIPSGLQPAGCDRKMGHLSSWTSGKKTMLDGNNKKQLPVKLGVICHNWYWTNQLLKRKQKYFPYLLLLTSKYMCPIKVYSTKMQFQVSENQNRQMPTWTGYVTIQECCVWCKSPLFTV